MLRTVLITLGVLMLIGAAVAAGFGAWGVVPQLLIGGAIFSAGVVWERWRYRRLDTTRPQPGWQATGERFVDPETDALVEVWYDPVSGERHYLRVPPGG